MISLRHISSSLFFIVNMLSPAIAFAAPPALPSRGPAAGARAADGAAAVSAPGETSLDAPVATAAAAPRNFVGTGAPVALAGLGVTITPPTGWDVEDNSAATGAGTAGGGLSVIMREPRDPAPSYDKPKYQRNVTVATIQHASPIDETRATALTAELVKNFSADPTVSGFTVLEHKFFNYRGTNDGLLVYSTLNIGDYQMMQMHVLVSGADKQFLMTYTDLADRFTATNDAGFEQAWNSMVSMEVSGATPARRDEFIRYGAILGGILLLVLVGFLVRRRAAKKDYAGEADALDGDFSAQDAAGSFSGSMIATMAGKWSLDAGEAFDENDGLAFSQHYAPQTKPTEWVSSF
jgi:hypothetical protein